MPRPKFRSLRRMLDYNPRIGPIRKGSRRFWTTTEIKTLTQHYPLGGLARCLRRLPGRSASTIYQKANKLKLVAPVTAARLKKGVPRNTWRTSPQIDLRITQAYPRATNKRDVLNLARLLNRPRWWVSKRAAKLGLIEPRFKEPVWHKDEIDFIESRGHMNPEVLSRTLRGFGYRRTATAITVKLKRLNISREDPNHFTARGFSLIMGVDATTVGNWIERGLLTARKRGTARTPQQGGDQWWIHHRDARLFIIDNAGVIDIRKVDKISFIELLAHGHHD